MPSTYTSSELFKEGSEKDWPAKLGGLDWDTTRIVFTKRKLVEFLRYMGTSVDPNLNNIAKLPRYADFGMLEETGDMPVSDTNTTNEIPGSDSTMGGGGDPFIPSRRVRTVPSGTQTLTLGDDSGGIVDMRSVEQSMGTSKEHGKLEDPINPAYKPSRRVRDGPGGPTSMANLWDEHVEVESFKPTRRVREGPGGKDSVSQIL